MRAAPGGTAIESSDASNASVPFATLTESSEPKTKRSFPGPPVQCNYQGMIKELAYCVPFSASNPSPGIKTSSSPPPLNSSSPEPPFRVSFPAPPVTTSLPAPNLQLHPTYLFMQNVLTTSGKNCILIGASKDFIVLIVSPYVIIARCRIS